MKNEMEPTIGFSVQVSGTIMENQMEKEDEMETKVTQEFYKGCRKNKTRKLLEWTLTGKRKIKFWCSSQN